MYKFRHVFDYYNEVFPKYWDKPALSDYNGETSYTFGQLAEQIAKLGVFFEKMGIKPGDKIALCGRNCSNWAASYLAIAAYGGVIVSILHEFKGADIKKLVEHSDTKLLLVGPYIWKSFSEEDVPDVSAVVSLEDFSILRAKNDSLLNKKEEAERAFESRFPNGFSREDVHYRCDNFDDLLLINYTSGSTGDPKGVMLTYKNLSGNMAAGHEFLPNKPGDTLVSMLPLAHMFSQLAEFLFPLSGGCHIYFIVKSPSPSLLMKAFADVHPYMIVSVPLVIEKICKKAVFPTTNKKSIKRIWKVPVIGAIVRKVVKSKLMKAFGCKLKYFIIGGAALNPDVEKLLLDIKFPFVVGYGMTECAPLIGGCYINEFVPRSAGHILPGNEIRIDSEDPYNVVGEILIRGTHVMAGYYKNEEATKAVFDDEGWLHTGDLGLIDKNNNIFLRGRNKNMILSSTGQNIYPEEIEDKLNNLDGVIESVVVEREGRLVGLVFPDYDYRSIEFEGLSVVELMKLNLQKINNLLPKYSQLSKIELVNCEFEKTPKKSIKRFLYN